MRRHTRKQPATPVGRELHARIAAGEEPDDIVKDILDREEESIVGEEAQQVARFRRVRNSLMLAMTFDNHKAAISMLWYVLAGEHGRTKNSLDN